MAEEPGSSPATPAPESGGIEKRLESILFPATPAPAKEQETVKAAPEPETGNVAIEKEETEEVEETPEKETPEAENAETEGELTTAQVSQILGVKEDHLQVDEEGKLLFRTKVGDDVDHVTLDKLIKAYQTDKHVSKKAQKLYEEQQGFEELKAAETGKLYQQLTEATGLVRAMEQQLIGEAQHMNLDSLRHTNPAEWAAKRQELADRAAYVQQIKNTLGNTLQDQNQKQQQQTQAMQQQRAAKEAELILAKVPRWSDESVASVEIPQMQSFLAETYGFDVKEIGTIPDHRLILLALDAMKGHNILSSDRVGQKLQKIPKIIKAGMTGVKDKVKNANKTDEKRLRLKKSGSTADLAALLYDRL